VGAAELGDVAEGALPRLVIDDDWQRGEESEPLDGVGLGRTLAAFAEEEDVGDFEVPKVGHQGASVGEGIEDGLRIIVLLVGEAPRDGHRAVEDEPRSGAGGLLAAQGRPSSIISRTDSPASERACFRL